MDNLDQLKETLRVNGVLFEAISINETEIKKLRGLSKTTLVLNNQGELWAIKLYTNTQMVHNLHTLSEYNCLKYIDISHNGLKTLPRELEKLTGLQHLNIRGNWLTDLPPWIEKLTGLQQLDISFNELTKLPDGLQKLTGLQQLAIGGNGLTDLPPWIEKLTGLQQLDISSNKLTKLPDGIQKLTNLQFISIQKNPFQTLPIVLLPFLQKLKVSTYDVQIDDVSEELIAQGWQTVEQYYVKKSKELQKPAVSYLAELKVMIIGDGSSGKSCISKVLKEKQYSHNPEEPSTVGIELKNINHSFRDEQWLLRLWDLGGQAAYAATQTMFMTKDTLYLVVADARTEKQPDIYLQYIKALVPNTSSDSLEKKEEKCSPPVIMVINKVDENEWFGLNKHHLQSVYPDVQDDIVRFSCVKDHEKHEIELFNAIEKVLYHPKDLYGFRRKQWPNEWLAVRKTLMEHLMIKDKTATYIRKDSYDKMCKGLSAKESEIILTGCDDLGMVFAPIAKNKNASTDWIMHAEWVTKGINKLFKLKPADSYGKSELYDHMNNNENGNRYSRDETDAILGSLKDANLAFEETGKFVIPALLPEDPPKDSLNKFPEKSEYSEWQMPQDENEDPQRSEIRFRYPFLHPKVKQIFMVELYRKRKNPILCKYGACWYHDDVRVVMKEDGNDLVFYLKYENEEKSRAYENLCEVQRNIQQEMKWLHNEFKINNGEMLHVFRTGAKGECFAEYSNKDLHTLLHEMKVHEVPLPSIRKKLLVEKILRGSNEAMLKEELQKNRNKGDKIVKNVFNKNNITYMSGCNNSNFSTTQLVGDENVVTTNTNQVVSAEVKEAKARINALDELDVKQKEDLIKFLDDVCTAVEENDEKKKQTCESSFKEIIKTLGKHASKVVEKLAQFATIAVFVKGCL